MPENERSYAWQGWQDGTPGLLIVTDEALVVAVEDDFYAGKITDSKTLEQLGRALLELAERLSR